MMNRNEMMDNIDKKIRFNLSKSTEYRKKIIYLLTNHGNMEYNKHKSNEYVFINANKK
ncbi:hypothetical protein GCM10008910_38120 [Faecalicatena orotica]